MTLDVKFQENTNKFEAEFEGYQSGAGENGATFVPSVSDDGIISWTNDKGLVNPPPVNIKGEPGEDGDDGEDGVSVTHRWDGTVLTVTSASGTSSADLRGKDGSPGEDGDDGVTPHIGANGNWWIGETDTGTKAQGEPGQPGRPGADATLNEFELIASGEVTDNNVNGVSITVDNNGEPFALRDMVTVYTSAPSAAQNSALTIALNGAIVHQINNGVQSDSARYCRAVCVYSGKKWDVYAYSTNSATANGSITSRDRFGYEDDSTVTAIRLFLYNSDYLLPVGFKYEIYGRRA